MHHPFTGKKKKNLFLSVFSSVHGCRFAFSQWSSKVAFVYSWCVRESIWYPLSLLHCQQHWINYLAVTYQEELFESKTLKEKRDRNYSWNSFKKGHSCSIFFNPPLLHKENSILFAHFFPLGEICLGAYVGL